MCINCNTGACARASTPNILITFYTLLLLLMEMAHLDSRWMCGIVRSRRSVYFMLTRAHTYVHNGCVCVRAMRWFWYIIWNFCTLQSLVRFIIFLLENIIIQHKECVAKWEIVCLRLQFPLPLCMCVCVRCALMEVCIVHRAPCHSGLKSF